MNKEQVMRARTRAERGIACSTSGPCGRARLLVNRQCRFYLPKNTLDKDTTRGDEPSSKW